MAASDILWARDETERIIVIKELTVGVHVPSRTSGGGSVFYENLISEIASSNSLGRLVIYGSGVSTRFGDMSDRARIVEVASSNNQILDRLLHPWRLKRAFIEAPCDALVFAGTAISRVGATKHIFWPLTVAPLEEYAVSLIAKTASQRARWRLLEFSISRAARKADAAIYSSNYAAELYEARYNSLGRVPSTVIWPAVSLTEEQAKPTMRSGPQQITVLFVSHAYRYKRLVELIEAFADAFRATGVHMVLQIAGSIPDKRYEQEVKNAITSSGCDDRIVLMGNVGKAALSTLYENADIFAFPSASENAGSYALIDAFRYGVAVISSDSSSMPEICGPAALYVDVESRSDFAEKLSLLAADRELRLHYAQLSSERFHEFPSWKQIGEELQTFLQDI